MNLKDLKSLASKVRTGVRENVDEYTVKGRRIFLLAEGRLVNLAAAEGHPASVMDMSFATQALACEWMAKRAGKIAPQVYDVSEEIEHMVSKTKLASMGVAIDKLTPEQKRYQASWQEGT